MKTFADLKGGEFFVLVSNGVAYMKLDSGYGRAFYNAASLENGSLISVDNAAQVEVLGDDLKALANDLVKILG